MSTNTYDELRTTTVATATPSVTLDLTGITGYTDLVLVANAVGTADLNLLLRFNGSSSSEYSSTILSGNGTSPTSTRFSNQTFIRGNSAGYVTTSRGAVATIHIMNYSSTATFKSTIHRFSNATTGIDTAVGLWRNTAAINSITILNDNSTTFAAGTTFSLYGIKAKVVPGIAQATGGTISYDNFGYVYHTFTSSGTFTPTAPLNAETLVVAGGGGGNGGLGGGGAGGLIYRGATALTTSAVTVTVGAGGTGTATGSNNSGSDSFFGALQAFGGGGGPVSSIGIAGGSGGGAENTGSAAPGGASTQTSNNGGIGYGNAGGSNTVGVNYRGAGGGGAGAIGKANNNPGSGTNSQGGAGGDGLNTWSAWATATSTGASGYYAGGGGAGAVDNYNGPGGAGGGGAGGRSGTSNPSPDSYAVAGTANTGGGGGGAGWAGDGYGTGASGGSGIVIIRYAN